VNAYRFIFDEGIATGGRTSAGTEYDLILSWKHSDNVSFEVNAATSKSATHFEMRPRPEPTQSRDWVLT